MQAHGLLCDGIMDMKEFAGNVAGTIVVLILVAAALVAVGFAIAMIPVLLVVAPMTVAAVAIVFLVAWIRRRRQGRNQGRR